MRALFAIGLMGLLLLPSLRQWGLLVGYVADMERYATELCENADRPELKCHGKCHLAKEMNAAPAEAPAFPVVMSWRVEALMPESTGGLVVLLGEGRGLVHRLRNDSWRATWVVGGLDRPPEGVDNA